MKKITLLSLLLVGAFFTAQAQTEQGNFIAGGDASFEFGKSKSKASGTTVDNGKSTTINFSPIVGYFFMDRLAGGLQLDISNTTFKPSGTGDKNVFSTTSVGPFVKYYHDSGFFGMGSIGFGSMKNKFVSGGTTNESKTGIFMWRLGAGYAAFLNDNVSIEPMLSYGAMTLKDKDADPEVKDISSSFRISVAFNIFLDL